MICAGLRSAETFNDGAFQAESLLRRNDLHRWLVDKHDARWLHLEVLGEGLVERALHGLI